MSQALSIAQARCWELAGTLMVSTTVLRAGNGERDTVQAGETIGHIRTIFGDVIATIAARDPGTILYTLSSLRVNKGEALLGIGTPA